VDEQTQRRVTLFELLEAAAQELDLGGFRFVGHGALVSTLYPRRPAMPRDTEPGVLDVHAARS
jgi:hypothetical protein